MGMSVAAVNGARVRARTSPRPAHRAGPGPATVPKKKAPGDRWSPGASNFLKYRDFVRAGDRTRTGDVQLGKLAEIKGGIA